MLTIFRKNVMSNRQSIIVLCWHVRQILFQCTLHVLVWCSLLLYTDVTRVNSFTPYVHLFVYCVHILIRLMYWPVVVYTYPMYVFVCTVQCTPKMYANVYT